jgi:ribosomal protein S27AE
MFGIKRDPAGTCPAGMRKNHVNRIIRRVDIKVKEQNSLNFKNLTCLLCGKSFYANNFNQPGLASEIISRMICPKCLASQEVDHGEK